MATPNATTAHPATATPTRIPDKHPRAHREACLVLKLLIRKPHSCPHGESRCRCDNFSYTTLGLMDPGVLWPDFFELILGSVELNGLF